MRHRATFHPDLFNAALQSRERFPGRRRGPAASFFGSCPRLSSMTWPQGAIDQPTITGRPWLVPDSIQPLFACDHCTFSRVGDAAFFLERNDESPFEHFDE